MKDLHSHLSAVAAVAPAVLSASATTSDPIDLQGFDSAEVLIQTGAIAGDGLFVPKLQHSDTTTSGDFEDVAADGLLGAFPAALEAASVYRVGYKSGVEGRRRYVRVVLSKTSGTSIAASVTVLRGHPSDGPTA